MSTRFIVIAAQAEAASQVSDDFAALVPASTLARVSAAGTSTSEAITSDPEQALPRVVEDIRSHTEDIVLIDALPEGSVSTFDTLGWNLDVAASTNARVIAAFDTEGASPELIEREIEVLDRRARQHATRVAAVALPSAVASHVKTQLPVLELPFNAQTLDAASALEAPQVVTPLSFQADLIDRARSNRKRIVLPEPEDDRVLRAAAIVLERGIADLVLLGDAQAINARAAELGLDVSAATVVSVDDPAYAERYAEEFARLRAKKGVTIEQARDKVRDVSYFGTMMVHMGDADGMVSGAIHTTAHTIVPSFQIIKTAPGVSIVSSVFLMLLKDRVWAFGDCAVNPNPTPEQLADIAISSAATARQFGLDPKVAMLSYSTGTSGSGVDVDTVVEATRLAHEKAPDLALEGPIQFDASVDEAVASVKLPDSPVAGHANVFIFPSLNAGNIGYKAVQRSSGAVAIGPVLQGLNKPVNDLSRGALVEDIVNTVALTAVQAQG